MLDRGSSNADRSLGMLVHETKPEKPPWLVPAISTSLSSGPSRSLVQLAEPRTQLLMPGDPGLSSRGPAPSAQILPDTATPRQLSPAADARGLCRKLPAAQAQPQLQPPQPQDLQGGAGGSARSSRAPKTPPPRPTGGSPGPARTGRSASPPLTTACSPCLPEELHGQVQPGGILGS